MEKVEQAYTHLHDLDWLQDCDLARLPEVLEMVHTALADHEAPQVFGGTVMIDDS